MKSIFSVFLILLFVSCSSDDDPVIDYKEENEKEIQAYIEAHNLDATRTDSGLYYVIDEKGEGAGISSNSDVSVRFKGTYTDGKLIEENNVGVSMPVSEMLPGWAEGIQFFNEGGKGMVLIPYHLSFGNGNSSGIPKGSVIIVEFEVIDYDVENREEILEYIEDNDLDAIESGSGLFYVIEEEGSGEHPSATSNVTVVYRGYFTDGELFDQSPPTGVALDLDKVIPGWTEGIQYFKEGGSGQLLIPSSLGYGRYGNQDIPGGSVLVFQVSLTKINS